MMSVVQEAEALVTEYMKSYDSSHDIHHVRRVRDMAVKIARDVQAAESTGVDLLVVELGALFHDLLDHKYAADADRLGVLRGLLRKHALRAGQIDAVLRIVEDTGFSRERRLKEAGLWTEWHESCREFSSVQDADRLDAIGAFGVMRVSAYACRVNHPLVDGRNPDGGGDSAYQHFHDKLLQLSSTMRTPLGTRLAAQRHSFMLAFLEQLRRELALTS